MLFLLLVRIILVCKHLPSNVIIFLGQHLSEETVKSKTEKPATISIFMPMCSEVNAERQSTASS